VLDAQRTLHELSNVCKACQQDCHQYDVILHDSCKRLSCGSWQSRRPYMVLAALLANYALSLQLTCASLLGNLPAACWHPATSPSLHMVVSTKCSLLARSAHVL
jgi:hypothetical protein